ncbi:hypothetical protein PC9H_003768 [Pleurotus ostreatus]|uniref:FAM192A/Fyv6 N-terminal domain-containing protein n=2 Tax=Pleurotus TaxID=5320 RepID=A0A8H7A229_PLEOS|nr:uncharacterized protein PC9H_003768 [Pleurotus ostreatus]KAF7436934.1 hypothetical protein PC9H_003768 [Pleurotus ostreatus]KAG9222920.1 hypothetical protein CCMSSC00406_0000391 [Pleurotus cornucopiae]
MEESMVPSLSSGAVGSRFVSQDDVETARARRDEQWKAAYARHVPPPAPVEDSYDGRSLAEKLAANKIAKQEEWEEKTKLANQYRALEEDEVLFLDSIRERQEAEERERKEQDGEEVRNFKEAVAARATAINQPPASASTSKPTPPPKPIVAPAVKKDAKRNLKGVIVKKKAKPAPAKAAEPPSTTPAPDSTSESNGKVTENDEDAPAAKRRKTSTS